ncbi:GntR family transcriptional regulator [Marmoricola endophyticus]|uniref:GntR family transcriptional regulator n=1 Tax=Marmoricola endophyticus TaxID=2040280 RepID=A0A917F7B8_9ACTN|nr:FCD domain-containing protein [Marmoricola endophyticus]GGF53057.1 GntR family transcriptional regulator [Marmoricola endophyticus]
MARGTPLEYERVAQALRDMIVRGDLRPGDRLPVEDELTARMGVSRNTLREAIRVLTTQKLLRPVRGVAGGTFVAEPTPADVADYLETSLTVLSRSRLSVAQLLEVRTHLEVPAAASAARNRTDADLERLQASIVVVSDSSEQNVERWWANITFHGLLVEAGGNPLMDMVTSPVLSVLRDRFLRDQAEPAFWRKVADEHQGILDAVRAQDARAAERAMRSHLSALRDTYTRIDAARIR